MTREERIEDAITALQRSADADERSADAAERSAAALEQLVKLEEHEAGRRACGW